ncbi:MAG: hypothetical protein R3A48_19765 [Polyangiales bacterium]
MNAHPSRLRRTIALRPARDEREECPPMTMLIVVRDPVALRAAAAYLAHRRGYDSDAGLSGEVLGVWQRPRLDAGLPLWRGYDGPGEAPRGGATVGLRQSFTMAAMWSLCWLDGAPLREVEGRQARRLAVLEHLIERVTGVTPLRQSGPFVPVFDEDEPCEELLEALRARHPRLVSSYSLRADLAGAGQAQEIA